MLESLCPSTHLCPQEFEAFERPIYVLFSAFNPLYDPFAELNTLSFNDLFHLRWFLKGLSAMVEVVAMSFVSLLPPFFHCVLAPISSLPNLIFIPFLSYCCVIYSYLIFCLSFASSNHFHSTQFPRLRWTIELSRFDQVPIFIPSLCSLPCLEVKVIYLCTLPSFSRPSWNLLVTRQLRTS